jgi:hypothetical protein
MVKCSDCRFWAEQANGASADTGECRQRSPQITAWDEPDTASAFPIAYWPVTSKDEWCGEVVTK